MSLPILSESISAPDNLEYAGEVITASDSGLPQEDAGFGQEDNAETQHYLACLQALLLVAGQPLSAAQAARALRISEPRAADLLDQLVTAFAPGGLQIVRIAGGFQLATLPQFAPVVARMLEPLPQRLSQPALETLALIAYRQPLTLPEIEAIRGVKSDSSVRTLLERGIIEDTGRKDVVGRPILYRTTDEFLHYLGMDSLDDLPILEGEFASLVSARTAEVVTVTISANDPAKANDPEAVDPAKTNDPPEAANEESTAR